MTNNTTNKPSAGRVLIVPRGEWDENATYNMLDLVNHNGYAYLAKRTVTGIEPSNEYPEYWHNMLDINKIVENAIAETVADEVGDILEERFREMLSEALYVTDLNADYDMPTFVKWDAETNNTPYKAGLTESAEGFALVYGLYNEDHTIVSWTKVGESFTHRVLGGTATEWDKTITSSGGTMTGPLGLGNGKGSVSADEEGTFIEAAQNTENFRQIKVENPSGETSLEESAKIVEKKDGALSKFNLFGEHNMDLMSSLGMARIESGSYIGTGSYGSDTPNSLTFSFVPKIVLLCHGGIEVGSRALTIMVNGAKYAVDLSITDMSDVSIYLKWEDKGLSWWVKKTSSTTASKQFNEANSTYFYVAIG